MSAEYLELQELGKKLAKTRDGEGSSRDQKLEDVGKRLAAVVLEVIATQALSTDELIDKARIAMEWINPEGDMADLLALSLCRDVVKCLGVKDEGGALTR